MMRNLGGMMKKVQEMQARMAELQTEMENRQFTATSGGGAVSVTLTGKGRVLYVSITPDACDPEDTETLEDMIKAAVNKAREDADKAIAEAMAELTGGLPLPPGLQLPF